MKIMTKLILSMLLIGILPIVIVTILSLTNSSAELEKSAMDKLDAVKTLKLINIKSFFDRKERDLKVYGLNSAVRQAADRYIKAFNNGGLNSAEYRQWEEFHGTKLKEFNDKYDFFDIFFIDMNGNVCYTAAKEGDLGKNLVSGSLAGSPLAEIYNKAKNGFAFQDFQWYDVSNEPASFIGQPIADLEGNQIGVFAAQISLEKINEIMQETTGMGETGETYIVGPDKKMRSDSRLDPEGHSVKASFAGTVKENGVDTEAVSEALAGKSETKFILDYNGNEVLSSYSPVEILGENWVFIAEIDRAEIMEPVNELTTMLIIIGLVIAAIVALVSVFLSRSIVAGIKAVVEQIVALAKNVIDGKLDARGKEEDVGVDFREIIVNLNNLIDAFVGPINVTAEYVDRISKGDIPEKITDEYKGDFNEIKNNLNQCIDAVNLLVTDAKSLSLAAADGKLDTRADASRHMGDFRAVVEGVNLTLDNVIGPLNVAAEYVDRISKGDIPPKIEDEYKGDFNEIKNNLNACIDVMNGLLKETDGLINATKNGQLDRRGDSGKFVGGWGTLVSGVNDLIDAFVGPINVTAEYVDRISKGDIPEKITDEYKGDFNEIKNNLNQCIDAVNLLVTDAKMLSQAAIDGKLDTRADATRHNGDFRAVVEGVNLTLDNVIGPLNVAAEYVDRISKGDIPPKIEDEYKGDFNEIKNNLNLCIDSVNMLVTDVDKLIIAASKEEFETRANADNHNGDFRKIVEGVNKTLELVAGKLFIYEASLDSLPFPVSVTDMDMNWIFFNKAVSEITGLKREDMLGKQCSNWNADICETERCGIQMLRKGNLTSYFKQPGQDKDFQVDTSYIISNRGDKIGHIEVIQDITATNRVREYQANEVDKIASNLQEFANGNLNIDTAIGDGDQYTVEERKNFLKIKDAIDQSIIAVRNMAQDAKMLSQAAIDGKLDTRADATRHNGDFRAVVEGVNLTLDNVIGPLNVAAEYVDRISKGDIPNAISDEYKGDFNEIKNNINQLIDMLETFIKEMMNMSREHDAGDIDVVMDVETFQGCYRDMAQGVNDMVNGHISVKKKAMACLGEFGKGNFDAPIEKFPGKKAFINDTIEGMRSNLYNVRNEINGLIAAAKEGRLDERSATENFAGDWRELMEGMNELLASIVDPLTEAQDTLSVLATGDLTVNMTGEYKGDFQKLKDSINTLADSLSNAIKQVLSSVETSASSALEISSTAESMASASQEQAAQADEVATAVEEMSRTITENAMSAGKTSEVAKNNGEVARQSGDVVDQTVKKMRDIAEVVRQSASNIQKLGESSKEIGEIISVIDDIADQTNLLALNAAIEAARAGEQGRGFAVVADEVRKLAERTTEATKQIANMIKGIQTETEQAVKVMNQGTTEVSSGIELADKAGKALDEILNSTNEVLEMINQIAAASEEQSSTSEQISKNVHSISQVTNESTRQIQDIAGTAEELAKLTDHLQNLMNQFKVEAQGGSDFAASRRIGRSSGKTLPPSKK